LVPPLEPLVLPGLGGDLVQDRAHVEVALEAGFLEAAVPVAAEVEVVPREDARSAGESRREAGERGVRREGDLIRDHRSVLQGFSRGAERSSLGIARAMT